MMLPTITQLWKIRFLKFQICSLFKDNPNFSRTFHIFSTSKPQLLKMRVFKLRSSRMWLKRIFWTISSRPRSPMRPIWLIYPKESKSKNPSKLIRRKQSSFQLSSCYIMRVNEEAGSERGTIFTSLKPSTKFKKSERSWRQPRRTGWPLSRGKSSGIKFQPSSRGSGRRRKSCSFIELLSKKMIKWKLWSRT